MTNQIKEDLRELSQIVGVSSREGRVVKLIKEKIEPLVDDIKVDVLGNLIATINGTKKDGPKLMLDAHTDEIGIWLNISHLMVSSILL